MSARIPEYLYVLVGSDSQASQVEARILKALQPLGITTKVQANVVKNRNDDKRNFAYVRVSNESAYNVLIGKTADGKENVSSLVHPEDDKELAKTFPDYAEWEADFHALGEMFDSGELSWVDYGDEVDALNAEFSKGKTKKSLIQIDYVIKPLECPVTDVKPNVLLVVTDLKCGSAEWLTTKMVESLISLYISEDAKKGMEVFQTNRGIVINFDKHEKCGMGISKLLHGIRVDHPDEKDKYTRLFFNPAKVWK